MEANTIIKIIFLGIALSMDAFAVAITLGLTCNDLNKKRNIFIALFFGFMQGLMPFIGYWIVELFEVIIGNASGQKAAEIMAIIVTWIAFVLLIILGSKMLIEGIKDLKKNDEEKIKNKNFKIKEVIYLGVATSIDALGSGVALHSGISNNYTLWLHISIIMIITFIISLLGIILGNKIEKILKGRIEITSIIGGIILILLAIWIISEFYLI